MFQKEVILFGRNIECFVLIYKVLFSSFCLYLLLASYLKIIYCVAVFTFFFPLMLSWALHSAVLNLNNSASAEKDVCLQKESLYICMASYYSCMKKASRRPQTSLYFCTYVHICACLYATSFLTSFPLSSFFPKE